MGKKELLARILCSTGAISVIRRMRILSRGIIIIAYHRIYDINGEQEYPFDPELVSASVEDFKWQMKYIKKYFLPSSFEEVISNIENNRAIPKRTVIVTFDDGHLDNYLNAFPILKSLGIPATIFLSTGYVGGNQLFWFEEVAYLLYRAEPGRYSIPVLDADVDIDSVDSRREAAELVLGCMKRVSDKSRKDALEQLRMATDIQLRDEDKLMCGNLTWPQVKEMSRNGIEFGSHTVNHPILTKVGDKELEIELTESRKKIEQELGKNVQVLAYPVGGKDEYDDRVVRMAGIAGYKMGVSYISGVNRSIAIGDFDLTRLHIERYIRLQEYQAMLELPIIFS